MSVPRHRLSAFNSYRVAEPFTLADIVNTYNVDPETWGSSVVGAATISHDAPNSAINLNVTTANGDEAILQTHSKFRYQPGKGLRVTQTLHLGSALDDQTCEWGFADGTDGAYWVYEDGVLYACIMKAGVERRFQQANFSEDVYSALDVTKSNSYQIDVQWLGVGVVDFFINGVHVHSVSHANTITGVYMRTATLPLRYRIVNTAATTGTNLLKVICSSIEAQGGTNPPEFAYAASRAYGAVSNAVEHPLLALQCADTINSVDNRKEVYPFKITMRAAADCWIRAYLNPTSVDDGTFAQVDARAGAEVNDDCTAWTKGAALLLGEWYLTTNETRDVECDGFFKVEGRHLRKLFPTGKESLVVVAQKDTGSTTTVNITLSWREVG